MVIDNWVIIVRNGMLEDELKNSNNKKGVMNIFKKFLNVELKIVVVLFFLMVFVRIMVEDIGVGI